jgi:hypothetical protein
MSKQNEFEQKCLEILSDISGYTQDELIKEQSSPIIQPIDFIKAMKTLSRNDEIKGDSLQSQFCKERMVDMFDFDYAGLFPYYNKNKEKWGYVSRGLAWQWYAEWLESKMYDSAYHISTQTASDILLKHEDANEHHFHEVDRKWIIDAMEEYAKLTNLH